LFPSHKKVIEKQVEIDEYAQNAHFSNLDHNFLH